MQLQYWRPCIGAHQIRFPLSNVLVRSTMKSWFPVIGWMTFETTGAVTIRTGSHTGTHTSLCSVIGAQTQKHWHNLALCFQGTASHLKGPPSNDCAKPYSSICFSHGTFEGDVAYRFQMVRTCSCISTCGLLPFASLEQYSRSRGKRSNSRFCVADLQPQWVPCVAACETF